MTKASLKNHRQSPRKVRLVVDAVRGKKADDAIIALSVMPKKAANPIMKLIKSAAANAKNNDGIDPSELVIKEISVDEGVTLKRWRPKARGTAHPIRKRSSHVKVMLSPSQKVVSSKQKVEKTTKKVNNKNKKS
jgi:large subunit ribosomal protein L22